MAIKTRVFGKNGKLLGYKIDDKKGTRFVPNEDMDRLNTLEANADFDGAIYRIMQEKESNEDILNKMDALMNSLKKISTYEKMSSKKRFETLAIARKAFNLVESDASGIWMKLQMTETQDKFESFWAEVVKNTHIKKTPQPLDLKAFYDTIGTMKLDELKNYMERGFLNFTQRVTLFDLYNKSKLEPELVKMVLNKSGSQTFYETIDEMMMALDKDFPAGYVKMPVVRVSGVGSVSVNAVRKQEPRRISLDYLCKVWAQDTQATFHNAACLSAYRQAGIDLVMLKNRDEGSCEICGPDVGKIFSISGTDPDFPIAPYLPRHPNCDCYYSPMLTKEWWRQNPLSEEAVKKWKDDAFNAENELRKKEGKKLLKKTPDGPLPFGVPETDTGKNAENTFGNPDFVNPVGQAETRPYILFKPAKTIREAQDWAVSALESDIEYGTNDLPVLNYVHKTLSDLEQKGKILPGSIRVSAEDFQKEVGKTLKSADGAASMYLVKSDTIVYNPLSPSWNEKTAKLEAMNQKGYWSTDNPQHPALHENAHRKLRQMIGPGKFQKLQQTDVPRALITKIEKEVGDYAAENLTEFYAEVAAGIQSGNTYSQDIMKLYDKLEKE